MANFLDYTLFPGSIFGKWQPFLATLLIKKEEMFEQDYFFNKNLDQFVESLQKGKKIL